MVGLRRCGAVIALAVVAMSACSNSPIQESVASPGFGGSRPVACAPLTHGGAVGGPAWTTYHADNQRTGVGDSGPNAANLHPLWRVRLDQRLYGNPLLFGGAVFLATENDTVYKLDLASGCVRWQASIGASVDATHYQCGNIPRLGITATPVIDPSTQTLYALGFIAPGKHVMAAIDMTDGKVRWVKDVDFPGSKGQFQLSRGALLLSGGQVYGVFGGRAGDCGDYRGAVVAVAADGNSAPRFWMVPGAQGGIWSPAGVAQAADGSLLLATGNTESAGTYDYGNSVVRLDPSLNVADSYAPANWLQLNKSDLDLGSTSPALLEDNRLLQVGKDGNGYLLQADKLGGIGGELAKTKVCTFYAAIGGAAYRPPLTLVPCDRGLAAVRNTPDDKLEVAWRGPVFRSGSAVIAGDVAWVQDFEGGYLDGLSMLDGHRLVHVNVGVAEHFVSPTVAGGYLIAPVGWDVAAFR